MKVSIIGGGGLVGSSAGFALQCGGVVREIALLDVNLELAQGQALDLLDVNEDIRQDPQVLGGAPEGRVVAAGVDDLLEQGRACTVQVNAQAF